MDEESRIYYPTIAKRAIAAKIASDSLSEEMRVLYVALTRARDRLIMTYASKKLAEDVKDIALRMGTGDAELLTRDALCPGRWVLMAALRRGEAGALFALAGAHPEALPGKYPWRITLSEGAARQQRPVSQKIAPTPLTEGETALLRESLTYRYPNRAATQAPSKQTATQRKGRDKDQEAAQDTREERKNLQSWRKPGFLSASDGGAAVGTATHQCLQFIRYEACTSPENVENEIRRLVDQRFLTAQQGQMVDSRAIYDFFRTELGEKLRRGRNVLREFKFSILDDGENYAPGLAGEEILLQGVVDCALIEDDGITVVDFKTDYVTEQTLPQRAAHYAPQILAYAGALERIYGKKVKESLLYFFRLGKAVSVK